MRGHAPTSGIRAASLAIGRSRIVLDIETTGFSPKTDRIVSIAAAVTSAEPMASSSPPIFSRLVNPNRHIPSRATMVHGITDEQVSTEPDWSVVGAQFWAWVFGHCAGHQPAVLVGHNIAKFDMPFILAETVRFRSCMPKKRRDIHVVDTLLISREMFPKQVLASKKQCDVHEYLFGVQPAHQHTALGDVMALKRIFEHEKFQTHVSNAENGGVACVFNYSL